MKFIVKFRSSEKFRVGRSNVLFDFVYGNVALFADTNARLNRSSADVSINVVFLILILGCFGF